MNLKEAQDLYSDSYKASSKRIRENLNKMRASPCSKIGKLFNSLQSPSTFQEQTFFFLTDK